MLEDVRAWRVCTAARAIAQNLRPPAHVDFTPRRNWDIQSSTALLEHTEFPCLRRDTKRLLSFVCTPFTPQFHDDSGELTVQYPIRFSAGVQDRNVLQFPGQTQPADTALSSG